MTTLDAAVNVHYLNAHYNSSYLLLRQYLKLISVESLQLFYDLT